MVPAPAPLGATRRERARRAEQGNVPGATSPVGMAGMTGQKRPVAALSAFLAHSGLPDWTLRLWVACPTGLGRADAMNIRILIEGAELLRSTESA